MAGYEKLLDKAVKAVSIPETKDRQNRNIKNIDVKEIINKCNDIIKRLF